MKLACSGIMGSNRHAPASKAARYTPLADDVAVNIVKSLADCCAFLPRSSQIAILVSICVPVAGILLLV